MILRQQRCSLTYRCHCPGREHISGNQPALGEVAFDDLIYTYDNDAHRHAVLRPLSYVGH